VKRASVMRRRKKQCPWCTKGFNPHHRLGDRQITCGSKECKHKQKLFDHRRWKRKNRYDYLKGLQDWRESNRYYWKKYRLDHPAYTTSNRIQTRLRKPLAKLGLQKRIDILQLTEKEMEFWQLPRFAKQPRSIFPLLYVCSHHQNIVMAPT
jgi:hypothetical protein